jgi:hypothetical protein
MPKLRISGAVRLLLPYAFNVVYRDNSACNAVCKDRCHYSTEHDAQHILNTVRGTAISADAVLVLLIVTPYRYVMCSKQQTACIYTPQTLVAPEEMQLNVNGLKGRRILKKCMMQMAVDSVRFVGIGVGVVCNRWRLRC